MTTLIPPAVHRYDVYDIAYLAGGAHRVVDTALVALVESGRVRVRPTGRLHAVTAQWGHPVEAAVLDALGPRPRHSATTVRERLAGDARLTTIADRLTAEGLLTGRRRLLPGDRPALSRAGRRALAALRSDPPAGRGAGGTSAPLVALAGTRCMRNAEQRALLFDPPRPPRRPARRWSGSSHPGTGFWAGGGWGAWCGDGGGGGGFGDGGSGCGGDGGGGGSC